MAYGEHVIQRNLDFSINKGEIFIVMGESGCGKSTLLRHLIGLNAPASGTILRNGIDFWNCEEAVREKIIRSSGILYQSGALWSSMTLAENIALPLKQFTKLSQKNIDSICKYKLALVGLAGCEKLYPSEISGGMRKRAGLARAMALDPEVLFFDEPSAGLDPISARRLDDLILQLRDTLGATIVVITHELASILSIGTDSIFLDAESKTMTAHGNPKELLKNSPLQKVRAFLTRGEG